MDGASRVGIFSAVSPLAAVLSFRQGNSYTNALSRAFLVSDDGVSPLVSSRWDARSLTRSLNGLIRISSQGCFLKSDKLQMLKKVPLPWWYDLLGSIQWILLNLNISKECRYSSVNYDLTMRHVSHNMKYHLRVAWSSQKRRIQKVRELINQLLGQK